MEELMEMLECIVDNRQQSKVKYSIKEIVLIVFCFTLSNVDDWEDMEIWANHYIDFLREYLEYANGIPSHGKVKSMRQKRMVVSFGPVKYLDYVLSL